MSVSLVVRPRERHPEGDVDGSGGIGVGCRRPGLPVCRVQWQPDNGPGRGAKMQSASTWKEGNPEFIHSIGDTSLRSSVPTPQRRRPAGTARDMSNIRVDPRSRRLAL